MIITFSKPHHKTELRFSIHEGFRPFVEGAINTELLHYWIDINTPLKI